MSSFTNISIDADLALWRDKLTLLLEMPAAERARELPAVLAQLRNLSAHAYMAMEANEGLITALEWRIQEFSDANAVQCNSTIELEPDSIAPEGILAITALRIFQEMLSNVARHARATSVRIRIKLARALLQMDVTDDGVGALPESFERSRSYGVMGMRRQALNFGGSLHIFSVQGGGTHVCLRLPLSWPGAAA